MTDAILRENQVLTVRGPVLFDSDSETKGSDLEHVTAVDIGGEERRLELLIALRDEAEFLAVGRNIRVGAAVADALPVVAGEIHTPERLVDTVEAVEHDP